MMDEVFQNQQERENLSGADDCEAWHEHNRTLINAIHDQAIKIKGIIDEQKRNSECAKTPF